MRTLLAGIPLAIVAVVLSTDVLAAGPVAGTQVNLNINYGLATAKRANCMGCHKWHGNGGPGYGGAAISLRKTQLSREEIITVIKCGRPGTNMPYFDKTAYKDNACYDMTFDDFAQDADNRPLQGKRFLNDRQVNAIADFVVTELQGKTITKTYCEQFFGRSARQCEEVSAQGVEATTTAE